MKSVLQEGKYCYYCGRLDVDLHHVRLANCSRKKAEKYGLLVYLCREHHRALHDNPVTKEKLQKIAQKKLENLIGQDEYMKVFGKNYMEE